MQGRGKFESKEKVSAGMARAASSPPFLRLGKKVLLGV